MSSSAINAGATVPTDILEMRAAEQRKRIHDSVLELRQHVQERLDLRRYAQQYLAPAAGAAALLGLLMGYGMAGMFSRPAHPRRSFR